MGGLKDGGFVAVWQTMNSQTEMWDVYGQRFDATGTAVGGEFRINSYTSSVQAYPVISGLKDGGFSIAWQTYGAAGDDSNGIAAQRYAADGSPMGSEFIVNAASAAAQQTPAIAARADGGYVVAWNLDNAEIYARVVPGNAPTPKTLLGGDAGDSFLGSIVADMLNGGGGADRLFGLEGDDVLIGGAGDDLMEGGAGADRFVLAAGSGHDTVRGFTVGLDGVRLEAGVSLVALIETDADQDGVLDTRLELSGGARIDLLGVSGHVSGDLLGLAGYVSGDLLG